MGGRAPVDFANGIEYGSGSQAVAVQRKKSASEEWYGEEVDMGPAVEAEVRPGNEQVGGFEFGGKLAEEIDIHS